ncbi:uncharacterized protein LOC124164164 isoform X2 [Ischnura elegans]|nr:uncharacterized protein LOC124164164 isoform X2 [Ischnura elegans]
MTSHDTERVKMRRNRCLLSVYMATNPFAVVLFSTAFAAVLGAAGAAGGGELWPAERPPGMPSIRSLDVMCGKEHMDVRIAFSHPFSGIVFSKGQYGDPRCVYVAPLGRGGGAGAARPGLSLHPGAGFRTGRKAQDESLRPGVVVAEERHRLRGSRSGWTPGEDAGDKEPLLEARSQGAAEDRLGLGVEEGRGVGGLGDDGGRVFRFRIAYSRCGTRPDHRGQFYENTVVVQYDRDLLEVWDEAKRLRCEWFDDYEKKTASKPPMVIADLDVVQLDFRGDNVECWMEVQQGKGPWAPPVSGIVPLGTTLTLVIAINDFTGEFDMRVKSCSASDGGDEGNGHAIQLSDDRGCVLRPKMVGRFLKVTGTDGRATLLTYAFFSAFKFPGALGVHIRCKVEICRHGCPDHCGDDTVPSRHGALDRSGVRARRGDGPPSRVVSTSNGPTRRGELGTQGGPRSLDLSTESRRRRRGVGPAAGTSEEEVVGVSGGYSVISEADMAEEDTEPGADFEGPEDTGSRWWGRSRPHEVCVPAHGFGAAFLLAASAAAASAVLAGALFHRYRGTRAAARAKEVGPGAEMGGVDGAGVDQGGLWGWVAMRWPVRGG